MLGLEEAFGLFFLAIGVILFVAVGLPIMYGTGSIFLVKELKNNYKEYHNNKYFIIFILGLIPIVILFGGLFFIFYLVEHNLFEKFLSILIPLSIIGIIISAYSAFKLEGNPFKEKK